jgi:osmoprotectant transport system permease protein
VIVAQSTDQPFFRWDWVTGHLDDIWEATVEHLMLTGLAVGIGLIISLALSAIVLRWRKTYTPVTWATGILYTIPSLALFAFLVPITGLSTVTALIGLVSYTLLILIRNIVAGIRLMSWRQLEGWATPSAASSSISSSHWRCR